jgi:hypothetical protein
MAFEYEERYCEFADGTRYQPDFWLPESKAWFEVKGELDAADHSKILNLARAVGERGESVLLGGSPAGYTFGEVTQWNGLNLNAGFGRCANCDCWTLAMAACRFCGHLGTSTEDTTYIDYHGSLHVSTRCVSRCFGGKIFVWRGDGPVQIEMTRAAEKWSNESLAGFSLFQLIPREPL